MSHLSGLWAVVFAIGVVALMWYANKRNDRLILLRQFSTGTEPGESAVECDVRFPTEDTSTPCVAWVTPEGWYMYSTAEIRSRWSGRSKGVPYLTQPVFIPWTLLQYQPAKFPMRSWLRFQVLSAKVNFFVKREVAEALLQQAGKPPA